MNDLKLTTIIDQIKSLNPSEILAQFSQWQQLNQALNLKLSQAQALQKELNAARLEELIKETSFEEATFGTGYRRSRKGKVTLKNIEQCNELLMLLNQQDPDFVYEVKWTGPGVYLIKGEIDYYCGNTTYISYFTKKENK